MKYVYIAVVREIETGQYAYPIRVSTSDNLIKKLQPFTIAQICSTKKDAYRITNNWNIDFNNNGTYAFSSTEEDEEDGLLPF